MANLRVTLHAAKDYIYFVDSETELDKTYEVIKRKDGSFFCSCDCYRYQHGSCKHVCAVLDYLEEPDYKQLIADKQDFTIGNIEVRHKDYLAQQWSISWLKPDGHDIHIWLDEIKISYSNVVDNLVRLKGKVNNYLIIDMDIKLED